MYEKLNAEVRAVLEQLWHEHCGFTEITWFFREVDAFFGVEHLKEYHPELIILGEDYPPELALSVCDHPFRLLGGSLETTHWSDALLPRDADPVSRSACGYLLNEHFNLAEKATVILTLSNDNRRKLAGLLRSHGIDVIAVDLPPVCDTASSREAWAAEMLRAADEAAGRLGKKLSYRRLFRAAEEAARIRKVITSFRMLTLNSPGCMSPALRDLIAESVFYAQDRAEWLEHLTRLTGEIASWQQRYYPQPDDRPWVITVGSPVLFPNEKLPMLLDASGLYLADRIDTLAVMAQKPPLKLGRFGKPEKAVRKMARTIPGSEVSGAWTVNRGLLNSLEDKLRNLPVDGIVYHVLKGQIEYDFELPEAERLAAEYGVPVFRLETDYQQQDVEQLRIRMEAFAEMLRQRGGERMRMAQ
ncbi:MAG: 2-hydroxyacyl-CoA dehydratase [Clostridia bacterium]|nr:2-hydroxyacyl-CoA dehydratase [Clostridia bacterium]